jgi:peptide/nickel transport system substrate-binding protein
MRKSPICAGALKPWVIALGVSLPGVSIEAAEQTRIHLALDHFIRSFDPRQSVDANYRSLEELIHCSLMTFDAEGRPVPGIAAQLPEWTSAQVLVVKVRDDMKFSDGTAVTADDVASTWQSMLTDPSLARGASFRQLTHVQAQGKTVIFTLKKADASFPGKLALGILPAKLSKASSIESSKIPVCGPYSIKSRDADRIVLKKNPHYAGSLTPRFNEIEFRIVEDAKSRYALLESGELDLVQNGINNTAVKSLVKKNPQFVVIKRRGLNTTYLGFNRRDLLAGHPAVREAIAHAIDRQEIIDNLLGGLATPASTLLPPDSAFHHSGLQPRPLNLLKAEKILEEAGFKKKSGTRLELSYKTTTDIKQINIAKAIAAQLKKIGIKIVVQPLESKTFDQDALHGRMQLWSLNWSELRDPDALREAFSSQNAPPLGKNRGWYSNPKLDVLLEKGKITNSPEQRTLIYQEAQELLDKDLPSIFLWHEDQFAVARRTLKGFTVHADGRYTALTQAFFDD